jgi:hypothetical protein
MEAEMKKPKNPYYGIVARGLLPVFVTWAMFGWLYWLFL